MKKIYYIICLMTVLCMFACKDDEVTIVTVQPENSVTPYKIVLNESRSVTFSSIGNGVVKYEVTNTGKQTENAITKISVDDKDIVSVKDNELPKTGEVYVGKGTHKATAVFGPVEIGGGINVQAEGTTYINVME